MNELPKVCVRQAEVSTELSALGVSKAELMEAAHTGYRAAVATTGNDVPGMFGMELWGKTFRGLADQLTVKGWTYDRSASYPKVVRHDGRIAIAVWNGDKATGNPNEEPSPKQPKGEETRRIVGVNSRTLFDYWYHDPKNIKPTLTGEIQTWVLLVRADVDNDLVLAELSLPSALSESGHIATWEKRIIFSESHPAAGTMVDTQQPTPPIDVPVKRRAQQ